MKKSESPKRLFGRTRLCYDYIPFTPENDVYILTEFLKLIVKNTRDSLGYPCVFCLDLKKLYSKSNTPSSSVNGINLSENVLERQTKITKRRKQ